MVWFGSRDIFNNESALFYNVLIINSILYIVYVYQLSHSLRQIDIYFLTQLFSLRKCYVYSHYHSFTVMLLVAADAVFFSCAYTSILIKFTIPSSNSIYFVLEQQTAVHIHSTLINDINDKSSLLYAWMVRVNLEQSMDESQTFRLKIVVG